MVKLDLAAVGLGALATMAVGIPVATIGSVVLDDDSDLVFFFAALAVIGFLAGGYVAGFRRPDTPMAHGAVAALAGFAVSQAVSAVLQVVRDESVSPVAVVFNALLAANIGLVGGILGAKRRRAAT
jgi:small basic protein